MPLRPPLALPLRSPLRVRPAGPWLAWLTWPAACVAVMLGLAGPLALASDAAEPGAVAGAAVRDKTPEPADHGLAVGLDVPDAAADPPAAQPTTRLLFRQQSGERSEPVLLDVGELQAALLDADGAVTLLLDREDGALTMLDPGERTVWQLDPPGLQRIAGAILDALQRARAELLQLDEDTRARAEQALAELLGAPAPATLTLMPQRERGRIAGLPCQWHALLREQRPIGRVCAARPAAVPGGEGWLALLQAMATAHAELTRLTAEALPTPLPPHPWQAMAASGLLPLHWQQAAGAGRESDPLRIVLERVETRVQPQHAVPPGYRDGFDPP
jgi:hypothetical protein